MRPELSIAIIFKDDGRCIERCLRSLQRLKGRVSCEIVMADTGSGDGSRAIAERYADVVFGFPWVNDFAAARNAVLDRCSGVWALSIDCDEWLDAEPAELLDFLRGGESGRYDLAEVVVRNYVSAGLTSYGDVLAPRLLRLGAKPRYEGAIHESPVFPSGRPRETVLAHTMLHHDGYVMLNDGSEEGRAKRARNVALLRAELEAAPDDLRRLTQFLESGGDEPDYLDQLRRAAALVEARAPGWERYGAALLRCAAQTAYDNGLPELDAWAETAQERFPRSYFTRIDLAYTLAARDFGRGDYESAVLRGEAFLRARRDFARDGDGRREMEVSFLQRDDGGNERDVRALLAHSYLELGRPEEALAQLTGWNWEETEARDVKNFFVALREIEGRSDVDILPVLRDCRERIGKPVPSAERAGERVAMFRRFCGPDAAAPRQVPPELLALAEKARALLAKLPPDDPAVIGLKQSEAYQKIAFLLEEDV